LPFPIFFSEAIARIVRQSWARVLLTRCLHHLPLFTHCCQHNPCCIASSQPGSRPAREPKTFENKGLDQCRTAAASMPPALALLRTAASRQVIAGVAKAWLRATHLSLRPCTVRSCTPITSYHARASSSAPSNMGDRITQNLQAEACGRKEKEERLRKNDVRRLHVTAHISSSSLPGGGRLANHRSLTAGWRNSLFQPPLPNNATSHAGTSLAERTNHMLHCTVRQSTSDLSIKKNWTCPLESSVLVHHARLGRMKPRVWRAQCMQHGRTA
jgi:hypothetical protein